MQTDQHHKASSARFVLNPARLSRLETKAPTTFPPLHLETRTAVDTDCAAFHLTRQPQTLRAWACQENGPIRPIRINGRLAWPVAELRRVLGVVEG